MKFTVIRGKIGPMSKHIPDEAVEAAVEVLWDKEVTARDVRAALEAAAPHLLAEAWEAGRVAGNHSLVQPNPYRTAK